MNANNSAPELRFAEWFRKNYPGPDTIIGDPDWHAPKIFRAAIHAARAPADLCAADRGVMALPTDNTALVAHVKKMQSYVQEYLEPGPYVEKHGNGGTFYEPHQHQSEGYAYYMRQQMREAVLNDLIYMLDGPEERAALASREAAPAVTGKEAS